MEQHCREEESVRQRQIDKQRCAEQDRRVQQNLWQCSHPARRLETRKRDTPKLQPIGKGEDVEDYLEDFEAYSTGQYKVKVPNSRYCCGSVVCALQFAYSSVHGSVHCNSLVTVRFASSHVCARSSSVRVRALMCDVINYYIIKRVRACILYYAYAFNSAREICLTRRGLQAPGCLLESTLRIWKMPLQVSCTTANF